MLSAPPTHRVRGQRDHRPGGAPVCQHPRSRTRGVAQSGAAAAATLYTLHCRGDLLTTTIAHQPARAGRRDTRPTTHTLSTPHCT